jgi:DNA-binding transcriptional MerR regulator
VTFLTIGELAHCAGVRPSTLRYYEEQGLLAPSERSEAGYRLYAPQAEQTLRFIQRAQRLGFSLTDIRALLQSEAQGSLDDAGVSKIAAARFLALERQITELVVMRHELAHFLQDLSQAHHPHEPQELLYDHLMERICPAPIDPPQAEATLDWLIGQAGCFLSTSDEQALLAPLRGRHSHIWQENGGYHILVIGHEPAAVAALERLAELEATCHAHPAPQLTETNEGYLLIVEGDNAFLFARLFLALEQDPRP